MRISDWSSDVCSSDLLLMSASAREVTRQFRAERFTSAVVLAVVISASILLSLFLARTIVRPLRRLAIAAQRVRAGRAREVVVPRLPSRRDEIDRKSTRLNSSH